MPHDMFYLAHRMLPFFFFKSNIGCQHFKSKTSQKNPGSQLCRLWKIWQHESTISLASTINSWCPLAGTRVLLYHIPPSPYSLTRAISRQLSYMSGLSVAVCTQDRVQSGSTVCHQGPQPAALVGNVTPSPQFPRLKMVVSVGTVARS